MTRAEPSQAAQGAYPLPLQVAQTSLPVLHEQGIVPSTQSGQGTVSPEAGAVGAHCADGGNGTP